MTTQPKWPLHPHPDKFGVLSAYVKLLADLYGVGYNTFCINALGIQRADSEALSLRDPSDAVLERLSLGVGVPASELRKLHPDTMFLRICKEFYALSKTEEGAILVERWRRMAGNKRVHPSDAP